jgi:hypothetical protein
MDTEVGRAMTKEEYTLVKRVLKMTPTGISGH